MLLSVERIGYVWICRNPERFGLAAARFGEAPIEALRVLFYGFKALQLGVFLGWCYLAGDGRLWPPTGGIAALTVGVALIGIGQMLNVGVFYRLGTSGVFYGNKF